jgi:putative membrane protein
MNQLKAGVSNPACKLADPQNAANPCGLKQGLGLILAGMDKAIPGLLQLSQGGESAVAGATALAESIVKAGAGAGQLADGLGTANAGSDKLAAGAGTAAAGGQELASGLGELDSGANELSDGVGEAADGSGQLSDGANQLADGLTGAADGSGQLAEGLEEAAAGAPKLEDGAQRLSDEGTSKLIEAGDATAQTYGELYATISAGAERAKGEKMVFGAPEGAFGLAAYTYEIKGDDGEGGRNLARGLGGLAVLAAGAGAFALRRRLV